MVENASEEALDDIDRRILALLQENGRMTNAALAEAIRTGVPDVVAVSEEVRDRNQVLANGLNWNTQVMGGAMWAITSLIAEKMLW